MKKYIFENDLDTYCYFNAVYQISICFGVFILIIRPPTKLLE